MNLRLWSVPNGLLVLGALSLGASLAWLFLSDNAPNVKEEASMSENIEEIKLIFGHELQNRAVGYATTQKLVAKPLESVDGPFLSAFAALESFNQCVYGPIADKYGLSVAPTRQAKIMGTVSTFLFKLPPRYYGKFVAQAAEDHAERLRPLIELAPEEDVEFFSYLVAQEEIQIVACTQLAQGHAAEAAATLNKFLAEHAEASFHDCTRLRQVAR